MNPRAWMLWGLMMLAFALPAAEGASGTLKGKHFIVHYNTSRDFAEKVLGRAESEYDRITKNLGYARFDNYWTFEDRCTLYVYNNKETYLGSRAGIPSWSAGYAEYATRTISGFRGSDKFMSNILPHEITHLIMNDYIGRADATPKWFSEGVALSQEENVREQFANQVGKAIHRYYFIPIYLLSENKAFQGEHNYDYTYLAYAEAALLLNYLMDRHGNERFVKLCRSLRDGQSFEGSFEDAYRGVFANIGDWEGKFLEEFRASGGN